MRVNTDNCAGQVIIEKVFKTEDAARAWMADIEARYEHTADAVETHLWTAAKDEGLSARP